ncbi:D-glycero-beta-D-manno-heptose 1-phosphate adenylyltransferase [Sorangium sp. So ce834]|uniref:D-glycero-beta-D-manno-heptose 1-phosphate adenylyltransferase n=1 Tax=Sorangium sp. So ce834 TaxID=3133321 RepID=UPI003F63FD90
MIERLRGRLSRGDSPRFWVIGDVMLDRYYMGSVDRVSPEAPVPVMLLDRIEDKLGGAGNVAQNILALGGRVALAGRVGADEPAERLRALLARAGVLASGLAEDPSAVTTVKLRVLAGAQQLVRIDHERPEPPGSGMLDALLDGLARDLPQPDFVLLSDYAKGVVTCELIERLRRLLPAVPIAVDPKARDYSKYRGADLVTPNEHEAALAAGISVRDDASLLAAAERLSALVPGAAVLITRGPRGMSLLLPPEAARRSTGGAAEPPATSDRRFLDAPAHARHVFDVTGAGDTALAALAVSWASGLSWAERLHVANIAAGIKVGKIGAVPVFLSELLAALAQGACGAKLIERRLLEGLRRSATANGQRLVFTNGCFDVLHVGHLTLLEHARRMGDLLLVGINSDASVRRLKGASRPVHPAAERAALLSGFSCVDFVTIFDEDTPREAILACRPDVLVKGGDYSEATIVGAREVRGWGGQVEVVPLVAGRSSTRLIERGPEER